MNKRRSSLVFQNDDIRTHDGTYTPQPIRRRMPQIPTKRSASRQSLLNDEFYEGYKTPENSSHRGASLPPTPTKTPKILTRLYTQNKAFNSLPPTPGRQLPKPNVNHRSAKMKRNNLLKRTTSADYSENAGDSYDSYYMRPGAISAKEIYNEDYNYAYQSTDNLPTQPEKNDMITVQNTSDILSNAVNTSFQEYDDSYYSSQDNRGFRGQDFYQENTATNQKRKQLLGRRTNSPLLQQNTDSLESRDDELKDSFETAVSSISSSINHQRGGYSEYSTAGELSTSTTSGKFFFLRIISFLLKSKMTFRDD